MTNKQLKGVNLGGWLVLERWMTPRLFEDTTAKDEYSFMQTAGAKEKIEKHRQEFITESDFAWLAQHGMNAVRIPVGYWIIEGDDSYTPAIEYLDWAIQTASTYNIQVLIDLHGAKGSQNGQHHSGNGAKKDWYKYDIYREETIIVLEELAKRYYDSPNVWGIELLNEPKFGIVQWKLRRFYKDAYTRLARVARPGTHIVFHDGFTPRLLSGAVTSRVDYPVVMDVHWYQFASVIGRIQKLEAYFTRLTQRKKLVAALQKKQPIIIGEWSVVLSGRILAGRSKAAEEAAFHRHAALQIEAYKETAGWFYWTYKTQEPGIWDFRSQVEAGIIRLE